MLAYFSFDLPTWSEEQGWLKMGKLIVAGERLNPIGPKTDYPSSFQAFPIAGFIFGGLMPLVASRLVAILYALAAAFFFGRITQILSKDNAILAFSVMLLSLLTYSTAFYAMIGWHEVTHVNLLCGACTYFLMSLLYSDNKSKFQAIWLGIWLGLSFWTLYTPALFAFGVCLVLLVSPTRFIPWKIRWWTFGAALVTTMPLLVGLIKNRWLWLYRHFLWIVKGGEWENVQYSSQNLFSDAILRTIGRVGRVLFPQGGGPNFDLSVGVFPEWTLAVLAILGFFICFRDLKKFLVVTVPLIVASVILILSHATPWRASILGFFILMYSVVALTFLANLKFMRETKGVCCAGLVVVLLCHVSLFMGPINKSHQIAKDAFGDGKMTNDLIAQCGNSLSAARVIGALDHYSLILLDSALPELKIFKFISQDNATMQSLVDTKADYLVALSDKEHPSQDIPEGYQLVCSCVSHGKLYRVIKSANERQT